jgi:hypothetical protein
VLLDPRHLDIYFENEAEVIGAVDTIKFNKDKLMYGTTRQTLTEEHGEGFIFLHDYLNKRMTPGKFKICTKCPNTPSPMASYRLTCPKHNK